MIDARVQVLENQLDQVAGRMARVEEELRVLKRALSRVRVLEILHLEPSAFEAVAADSVASAEKVRSSVARSEALRAARKDQLLKRLDTAEKIAELTGKSFSEAWEMGKA